MSSPLDEVTDEQVAAGVVNIQRLKEQPKNAKAEAKANAEAAGLLTTVQGGLRNCLHNVLQILCTDPNWNDVLVYNTFSLDIEKRKPPPYAYSTAGPWEDVDNVRTASWLATTYEFTPTTAMIAEAVYAAARSRPYHPVRDYLNSREWDGIERINTWLPDFLGTPNNAYTQSVGRKFLISAIARIRKPGCKVDTVLILQGKQGILKSTVFRVLAGDDHFLDEPISFKDKDSLITLQGHWIVEMAELEAFQKADAEQAKLFLSKCNDKFRPPYGRVLADHPRQCVFGGTANPSTYLKDPTGNRRYWPVMATEINIDALREARDQLWAEADAAFKAGQTWWLDPRNDAEVIAQAEEETGLRTHRDPWEGHISTWVNSNGREFVSTLEILTEVLSIEKQKQTKRDEMRVAEIMHTLEWVKDRPQIDGVRKSGYWRPGSDGASMVTLRRG